MNFTSLRNIYLDWHLRVLDQHLRGLGHEDPSGGDDPFRYSPRPTLPTITCQHVLERLRTLPDLGSLQALQAEQQSVKPQCAADWTLKVFCECAGRPLIQAFVILTGLKKQLESLDPERAATTTFSQYQDLVGTLLEVRKSHAIWEVSVGNEAFFKAHPGPRAVRYDYLWYTLQLVYVVADLTFPEDFREHLQHMASWLRRCDWRERFILDSKVTYERSMKRARPEILAPPDRYPTRYLLFGQNVLRPCLVRNPSIYGHRLVPNERCLQRMKGTWRNRVHVLAP